MNEERMYLKGIPGDREITTALHQDEGIIIVLESGATYSFVPTTQVTEDGGIEGMYYLIENGQFTNTKGKAGLYIADTDTPEPIAWLAPLSSNK